MIVGRPSPVQPDIARMAVTVTNPPQIVATYAFIRHLSVRRFSSYRTKGAAGMKKYGRLMLSKRG
jgi:hypothetical protein